MYLETERLRLMPAYKINVKKVLDYLKKNKEFLKPYEPKKSSDYYNIWYQKKLLKMYKKEFKNGSEYRFWIIKKEDNNKIIGSIALSNIIRGAFQNAFLGYKLDKDEINNGYMSEAVNEIVRFAFDNLKLHRIEANVLPTNKSSIRVLEKNGFILEGYSKDYLKIDDEWKDHVHMVKLNKKL